MEVVKMYTTKKFMNDMATKGYCDQCDLDQWDKIITVAKNTDYYYRKYLENQRATKYEMFVEWIAKLSSMIWITSSKEKSYINVFCDIIQYYKNQYKEDLPWVE